MIVLGCVGIKKVSEVCNLSLEVKMFKEMDVGE